MASILRSSKFVRYIAGFARNIVFNTTREHENTILQQSQTLCVGSPLSFATAAARTDQNLERSLKRLDQDVRRTGRISRRDIEEVLDEIRMHRSATSSQSLLVIRCCGNLVPEELPEVRTALVQEIWKTLNNLNVPMDVSHYNALLRVYLENEHQFEPTEFLANLESKGIEPNRVTYQRLISRYCQLGDIEGATRILEFMREKQLPVNENVFNALIMGHSQADDMESAAGILTVMKQAGLDPSADTYTTLLCGYAKCGDINSITTTLDQCEKNEIYLLDKDLLDVIYALTTNGHGNTVQPILDRIRKSAGYNQDAVNLILRLTNKGYVDVAFNILKTMPRGSRSDGELTDTGNFFIKQLVKAKTPVEKVVQYCKDLQEEGLNSRALLVAIEAGLTNGIVDLTIPLLREIKSLGHPIRQHYFWPLICSEGKHGNDKVLAILNTMQNDFDVSPNNETIREYVIPNIREKNAEKLISMLRGAGVSTSTSSTATCYYLLQGNKLKEAANIASAFNVYYAPGLFRRPLIQSLVQSKDFDSYIKFVRQILDNLSRFDTRGRGNKAEQVVEDEAATAEDAIDQATTNQADLLGHILFDAVINFKTNRADAMKIILEKCVEQGLTISNAQAERIQDRMASELTSEISTLLGKLASGDLEPIPMERSQLSRQSSGFSQMEVPQLERIIAQQDAKGENSKGLKRFLLSACFRSKDLNKTEEVIEKLNGEGYILTSGVYAQLIDLYVHHSKVDEAIAIFDKVRSKEVDFVLDNFKTIRIVEKLVEQDKTDAALKFLEINKKEESEKQEERNFNYQTTCWRVLNAMAERGKSEELTQIFDSLTKHHFIEPTNVLLGPLIKVHLVANDLKKAVDTFEAICTKYRSTPWKNELSCRLIQAEDAANLQRLTDLSTNIHGEVNSLYDLVFSFVECGRVRQARKILETPGLRNRPQRINSACERYRQEGKVQPLEGLVEATKDMMHIDRGDIYYNLLLSYCKDDQPEKALGLWTKMQEEDITPTDTFLAKLASFLESKGIDVPFVTTKPEKLPESTTEVPLVKVTSKPKQQQKKPKEQQPLKSSSSQSSATPTEVVSSGVQQYRTAIRKDDLDAALNLKNTLTAEQLTVTDQSLLIELLLKADRLNEANKLVHDMLQRNTHPILRVFRFYLNKAGSAGDVAGVEALGKNMSAETKKLVSYDNRLCHANIMAGRSEQYLQQLDSEIEATKTPEEVQALAEKFPRGGAIGILEKNPECSGQFEKIAEKYAQRGVIAPMNVLWMHHFTTENTTDSQRIWDKYLTESPRLMFQRIVHVARENQNADLILKLIEQLRTAKITEGALGNVYSCLLDVYTLKEQYDNGLEALKAAIKDVCLENINRTALQRLKDGLQKSGKEFPYQIPARTNVKYEDTTSSSSSGSSSSSDDEPSSKKKQQSG